MRESMFTSNSMEKNKIKIVYIHFESISYVPTCTKLNVTYKRYLQNQIFIKSKSKSLPPYPRNLHSLPLRFTCLKENVYNLTHLKAKFTCVESECIKYFAFLSPLVFFATIFPNSSKQMPHKHRVLLNILNKQTCPLA